MRKIFKNWLGIATNIDSADLKDDYSPDCSDVNLSVIGQNTTRNGFDKTSTTSKNNPIMMLDQIENDGVTTTVIIQGTQLESI